MKAPSMMMETLRSAYLTLLFTCSLLCYSTPGSTQQNHPEKALQKKGAEIGYFDELAMELRLLDKKSQRHTTLVHLEDSISGLYRKTVWRPDGGGFAFTGTVNGKRATYIQDMRTSTRETILEPKGSSHEGVLEWHPQLDLIFVMKNIDGNAEIYAVKDSTQMRNLTKNPSWDFFPALFPDERIAFFSNRDETGPPNFTNVYVTVPSTGATELLLSIDGMTRESMSKTGIFPDISPDGTLMCFTMDGDIHTIGTDGTNLINLTNSPDRLELTPSFSLSGESILFSAESRPRQNDAPPNMNIYELYLGDAREEQRTFGDGNYFTHPIYRPRPHN